MGKRSREKQEQRLQNEEQSKAVSQRYSGLEKIYLKIIEWGIYLTLFTPLVFARNFFFPYVVPKTIFFRIIVDIIFVVYMLLVISYPKYRPRINVFTIAIVIFLGITILASFTGINFERSFWSTFERMTGLLTFFHLFAFFIILTNVFKERKYWERILTVSILVGVFLVFYVFNSDEPTSRGGGTLGNTSFMAAYLLFDIFFAIILFFTKQSYWKIFYGVTLAILLCGLFISQEPCRGAIGAFWGGIFLLIFGYLIFYLLTSGKKLFKKLAIGLIFLLIIGGLGFTQTNFFKSKLADVEHSRSWQARKVVWDMAIEGIKERPLLGWGEDNFNVPFAKYFDPKLPPTGDLWYDRVHNVFLDTAIHSGILGLLSYLSIFAIAAFSLFKVSFQVGERKNAIIPLGMIAVLAVYLAQNIWVFDMVSSYMIFFLSLAFIYFLIYQPKPQSEEIKRLEGRAVPSLLGALLIIITISSLYFGGIQPARASNYIVKGISYPLEESIAFYQKALSASPMTLIEGPEQFSRKVTEFTYSEGQDKEFLARAFEAAAQEMKKAIAKNPQDFRLYLLLGKQYNDFYQVTNNAESLELAEETLKKAKEFSPGNQQVYWAISQNMLYQERIEESISAMRAAVDLEPQYALANWYLAMIYKVIGDYQSAAQWIEKADEVELGWQGDLDKFKQVIEIYQQLQDNEKLIALYPLIIELDPQNAQYKAGFAVAYANLGQFDKAREWVEKALELNPDFSEELEDFLNQLPD
ncbi:MAG: O-antigen ligase family protein [bacterium]